MGKEPGWDGVPLWEVGRITAVCLSSWILAGVVGNDTNTGEFSPPKPLLDVRCCDAQSKSFGSLDQKRNNKFVVRMNLPLRECLHPPASFKYFFLVKK